MARGSMDIKRVFDSYRGEFERVEAHLRGMLECGVPLIPAIGRRLLDSGGKRMRPLFLLVSARLSGYTGSDHISLAGVVEMVHTASLLHDDVVDGAEVRRGTPAAHSIWGNQVVILVGDFLYSNALKHAVSFRNQEIMETLSAATTRMTQGELLQLQRLGDPAMTEEEYIEIVSAKTGALISASCRIGGVLGGCTGRQKDALGAFGMKTGVAFQMADDILDYMADEDDIGKTLGKDLGEGKVTLPVICLLRAAGEAERKEIEGIIEGELSDAGLRRMIELFRRYDVIEEAAGRAKGLVAEAISELAVFPPSDARDDLFEIAEYALSRDR